MPNAAIETALLREEILEVFVEPQRGHFTETEAGLTLCHLESLSLAFSIREA